MALEVWHFAVLVPEVGYCWPVCWLEAGSGPSVAPVGAAPCGQTLIRADVTCRDCLELMHA